MDLVRDINFKTEDKDTGRLVYLFGALLMLGIWALGFEPIFYQGYNLLSIPALPIVVVIHEALHGLLFLTWAGKVKFGFINSYIGPSFYSTSLGACFSKNQFLAIALIPQLLTLACLLIFYFVSIQTLWIKYFILNIAAVNLSGGCSDFYIIYVLLDQKNNIRVEDYIEGVRIWA